MPFVPLCLRYYEIHYFQITTFKIICAMRTNNKEISTSGWFGLEHHKEIHTVDFYRHIGMDTLCALYPDLFKPEIWLCDNPPKIENPKKKLIKKK